MPNKTAEQIAAEQAAANQNFMTSLSPEHAELAKVKGWKTNADVITQYQSLEKMVGHDHVQMPAKDAQGNFEPTGVRAVLEKLGTPKDHTAYVVPTDIKIDAGVPFTVAQLEGFKPIAHKHGLLPSQFNGVMKDFVEMLNQGLKITKQQQIDAQNKAELALRQEVGSEYETKNALADRALNSLIDAPRAQRLKEKYGNDPDFKKLMMNVGDNLSEETFRSADLVSGISGPAAAQAEVDKMVAEGKDGALLNKQHKDHQAAVDKYAALMKIIEQGTGK